MTIGKRLKEIRKDLGFSQEKFANELSIHLRSYVSYEHEHRTLPQNVLIQIVQIGYSVHWLLTGEGKMKFSGMINDDVRDYPAKPSIPLLTNISLIFRNKNLPSLANTVESLPRPEGCDDPLAYALRIKSLNDEGMMPFFHPEEIIIVSPMETVLNNDKAIIKLRDERILFKVLQFHDDEIELINANPKYPSVRIPSDDVVFAHKVIGSLRFKV